MDSYEKVRSAFKPRLIKVLFIAESPPPAANVQSSRHFYRHEALRHDDRLFTNTIRALYQEAAELSEPELEIQKHHWLERFKKDGYYMIEALTASQPHEATKQERQDRIRQTLPNLIERVSKLAHKHTKIILIKSNVFEVAAEPLRQAGFNILNTSLVDYPGHFNQKAYRIKVAKLLHTS